VGIAFRLQNDMKTYDAFYLRPTNGRADDQETESRCSVHLTSRLVVVPSSQRDTCQVRIVR
jgi:hypothetical protein